MNKKVNNGPDGLEAWGVALAACFINFVMGGLGRMSGILYVAFIDIFQIDRLQSSVPFSVRYLTRYLLGPVVGILGQKYGVPRTTVVGAVIGTLSAAACFYANDMLWITIFWGGMNGIATALTMTLPQVVLGKHFKKHRTTASGIAFSGACVAAFLYPVIFEYLIQYYGLGGSFLLIAGLIMHVIPAGMLLREPSWLKKEPKRKSIEISTIEKEMNHGLLKSDGSTREISNGKFSSNSKIFEKFKNDIDGNSCYHNIQEESFSKPHSLVNGLNIDTQFLRRENKLVILLITEYVGKTSISFSKDELFKKLEQLYAITDKITNNVSGLSKISAYTKASSYAVSNTGTTIDKMQCTDGKNELILVSDDMNNILKESKEFMWSQFRKLVTEEPDNLLSLFHEREHAVILKVIHQFRQIYELLESQLKNNLTQDLETQHSSDGGKENFEEIAVQSNTFCAHIRTALKLHRNPIFLLISFCRSVHYLSFIPAVTVIVDYSMDKGLVQEDGKYVIAALSFGDLFGRLCLGWVTDKEYLSLPRYMLLVMILQSACTACLTLIDAKTPLLVLITFFGLLQGSLFVRHPVLVSKYLGKNEQSVAMGCFNFFSGVLGFAVPSYIGYFRDTIGSYDGMFYINGGIGAAVGILWLFEPYFVKCVKPNVVCCELAS